jgi:hypothetical protein
MKALLVAALALTFGCAHSQKKDSTICPEYRDQVCLAGQDCNMDQTRGCRVCQCTSFDSGNAFTPTSDPSYIPRH